MEYLVFIIDNILYSDYETMIYIHKKLKMNLIDNIPNSLTCVKNFVHCIAQSAPHCPIATCWSMRQKTEFLDDDDGGGEDDY